MLIITIFVFIIIIIIKIITPIIVILISIIISSHVDVYSQNVWTIFKHIAITIFIK